MKTVCSGLMIMILGLVTVPTAAIAADTVLCESDDGNYKLCRTRLGKGARVNLTRKLSKSSCDEGRSWGSAREGIWVDKGCRAIFEVESRAHGHGHHHDDHHYGHDDHHGHHAEKGCPPGSRPGRCTDSQRKRGCKDWRTPSGLGCFTG